MYAPFVNNAAPEQRLAPNMQPACEKDPIIGCCKSPPEEMKAPVTTNMGCEKVNIAWELPQTCTKIDAVQIQIKKSNMWMNMLPIPVTWTSWEVSNNHFRNLPYDIDVGSCVETRMRAHSCHGWGKWSESSSKGGATVKQCIQPNPSPCGGLKCVQKAFSQRAQNSQIVSTPKTVKPDAPIVIVEPTCGNCNRSSALQNMNQWQQAPK